MIVEIKINCKLLSEQIQLLEMYCGVMSNKHNQGLVEGIINLLSEISFAAEEEAEVQFVREDN